MFLWFCGAWVEMGWSVGVKESRTEVLCCGVYVCVCVCARAHEHAHAHARVCGVDVGGNSLVSTFSPGPVCLLK